jgi:hypothetical protein
VRRSLGRFAAISTLASQRLFVFFKCFALNQWLQYRQVGKWKNYLYGERVYVTLWLIAKSLLAWQIFASALASSAAH